MSRILLLGIGTLLCVIGIIWITAAQVSDALHKPMHFTIGGYLICCGFVTNLIVTFFEPTQKVYVSEEEEALV